MRDESGCPSRRTGRSRVLTSHRWTTRYPPACKKGWPGSTGPTCIEVTWAPRRCTHAAECFRNAPEVFIRMLARGSGPRARIRRSYATVLRCPSGALGFRRLDDRSSRASPGRSVSSHPFGSCVANSTSLMMTTARMRPGGHEREDARSGVGRGAVVSLAAVTLALTVAVTPAEAATPGITGFSPSSGTPGTLVAVTGSGFTGGVAGVSAVSFNNFATTFNVADDQHLTATVPIGATTGKIRVTTSDGVGVSLTDFVLSATPTISSFSPSSGAPGTAVTINGTNLTGVNGVKFNGTSATFNFISNTQVMSSVPAGATTGKDHRHDGIRNRHERLELHGHRRVGSDHQRLLPVERRGGHVGHYQRGQLHRREQRAVQRDVGELSAWRTMADHLGRPHWCDDLQDRPSRRHRTGPPAAELHGHRGVGSTISGFSPSSGRVGTLVTINGDKTSPAEQRAVQRDVGEFQRGERWADHAVVPTGATTAGSPSRWHPGTATAARTSRSPGSAPTISGFSSSSGGVGTGSNRARQSLHRRNEREVHREVGEFQPGE